MANMETNAQAPLYEVEFIPLERRLAERRGASDSPFYLGSDRRVRTDRREPEAFQTNAPHFSELR